MYYVAFWSGHVEQQQPSGGLGLLFLPFPRETQFCRNGLVQPARARYANNSIAAQFVAVSTRCMQPPAALRSRVTRDLFPAMNGILQQRASRVFRASRPDARSASPERFQRGGKKNGRPAPTPPPPAFSSSAPPRYRHPRPTSLERQRRQRREKYARPSPLPRGLVVGRSARSTEPGLVTLRLLGGPGPALTGRDARRDDERSTREGPIHSSRTLRRGFPSPGGWSARPAGAGEEEKKLSNLLSTHSSLCLLLARRQTWDGTGLGAERPRRRDLQRRSLRVVVWCGRILAGLAPQTNVDGSAWTSGSFVCLVGMRF
ncbi:hypothetical protein BT67DRAFT_82941 [Trichocladium antarcticum]|uniref:Uncharacterized protein n=1 Tax=Trichocladium antarcticum TaxID=1450529 RepID=A0AAN6UH09_9PEZI|nr:hypothetical protein BT67DRAFT_82941 [Trichocladium antarcticum]